MEEQKRSVLKFLIENSIIQFMGGAIEVEEGYLSGFDNVEIKGFKSGAMFAPMIGSIPFVGYVFELENEADVPNFIKTLEDNANLRWNICVTADEMVSGSVGNKVFFVMAPASFDAGGGVAESQGENGADGAPRSAPHLCCCG